MKRTGLVIGIGLLAAGIAFRACMRHCRTVVSGQGIHRSSEMCRGGCSSAEAHDDDQARPALALAA